MPRKGNGEGSIKQRQDGRWEGRAFARDGTGRWARRSVYGSTRGEVAQKLNALIQDVHRNVVVPDARLTVTTYLTEWMGRLDEQVRPSTARRYRQLIRLQILPNLGTIPLGKLSPRHVQDLMGVLSRSGLAPRSVHHVRAVLRRALNQAVAWDLITRNSAALAASPRMSDRVQEGMSVDEALRILHAFRGTRLDAAVTVALYTGVRQGELLGLRWRDIDLENSRLHVRNALQRVVDPRTNRGGLLLVETKTRRSQRTVPLAPAAIEALRARRAQQAADKLVAGTCWQEAISDLVFTSILGRPMYGSDVTENYRKRLASMQLPTRTFHDLRHGCATLLLASGVDLKVVSDILGHSTITLTANTYASVLPALRLDAARRLDVLLASGRQSS